MTQLALPRLPPLPARLIHADAVGYLSDCEAALRAQPQPANTVFSLDASALIDFDSSALAVLLGLRRRVLKAGAQLQLTGAPPQLRDLATLYGVSELLPA